MFRCRGCVLGGIWLKNVCFRWYLVVSRVLWEILGGKRCLGWYLVEAGESLNCT